MAPSVKSPMTASSSTPKSIRPRRIAPIVPAIPRSLERKPRQTTSKPASPPVRAKADTEALKAAAATQAQTLPNADDGEVDLEDDADVEKVGVGMKCNPEVQAKATESIAGPEEEIEIVVDNKDHSSSRVQDVGIEKYGFKLPPPFSPKKFPAPAISTKIPSDEQTDVLEDLRRSPDNGTDNEQDKQSTAIKTLPIRFAVSNFHAHPTPPSEVTDTTSPTASSSKGNNLAQSFSFKSQPTPPTDVTTSPTQPTYQQLPPQGYGHAHNISFHPPPPLSSNGTTSPARSVYQSHAYQHVPHPQPYPIHSYPPHSAHDLPQPPPFFQHQAADSVQGQAYGPQPPFNHSSPFPTLGSQPPFTPSATPFSKLPQQWNYPNGYSQPAPWEYGYPPTDAQLQQPDSRHHSTSPSTLKSDRLTSGHGDLPDTAVLPNPEDSIETNPWRSTTLGTLRHAPANGLETPSSLVEYLLENLNNEEYADCRLNMIHENNRFAKADWSLSSLLIARSPRLRDTLRVSMPGEDGKRIIRLEVQGRFITPKSVEAALRVCYGEPTNAFTGANPHELISAPKANVSASSMDDCLDYVATGCILQLKEAALQGLEVASKILNWENLEAAVSFGLESVRQRGENASAAVIEVSNYIRIGADYTYLASEGDPSPSSCALFTPPSQQGPENAAELMPPERRYGPPVQSAYDLLIHCLRYIRDNFPTSWELDVTARPLADVDRLPVTRNSRSPLSRSRLGHIQFGQMPSEVEKGSSNPDVLISTIVLSVPFLWLNFILKTMGEPICRNLVSIVNERERRRHIILQSEDVNKKQRMVADAYEWGEAGFEESVKIADDGGMILSKRFIGIAGGPSPYTKVNLTDE